LTIIAIALFYLLILSEPPASWKSSRFLSSSIGRRHFGGSFFVLLAGDFMNILLIQPKMKKRPWTPSLKPDARRFPCYAASPDPAGASLRIVNENIDAIDLPAARIWWGSPSRWTFCPGR
jgi:hypothetical protein